MASQVFGIKIKSKNSLTLVHGEKVIQEERELAKTFNKLFVSILKILKSMKIFFLLLPLRQKM